LLHSGDRPGPALLRALAACDVTVRERAAYDAPSAGTAELCVRELEVAGTNPRLSVAPLPLSQFGRAPTGLFEAVVSARSAVSGAGVRGGARSEALPAPRTSLAVPVRLRSREAQGVDQADDLDAARADAARPAEAVWTDADGDIVVRGPGWAVVAADPDADGSTWGSDPSLPVLLQALLDHLGGGPERLLLHGEPRLAGPAPRASGDAIDPGGDDLAGAVAPARTVRRDVLSSRILAGVMCLLALALSGLAARSSGSRVFRSVRERTAAP
jgi:hypothetical protein